MITRGKLRHKFKNIVKRSTTKIHLIRFFTGFFLQSKCQAINILLRLGSGPCLLKIPSPVPRGAPHEEPKDD